MTGPTAVSGILRTSAGGGGISRLFCFPWAGAGSSAFRELCSRTHDVEIHTILLAGREGRFTEPLHDRLGPLIDELAGAIRGLLDRPFAFFGHSLGALVAFELVRRLRREQVRLPEHLFVSARGAPQVPPRHKDLHQRPDEVLLEELRRYQGTPPAALEHGELMKLLLPVLRADLAINETYLYTEEPPLEVPITALVGDDDPDVSPREMEEWRHQTSHQFRTIVFSGGHFYLLGRMNEVMAVAEAEWLDNSKRSRSQRALATSA